MKRLSAEDILKADDLAVTFVEVEEWGGEVGIRRLTAAEAARLESGLKEPDTRTLDDDPEPDSLQWACRFLALTLCDAGGKPLFDDESVRRLMDKSRTVVERLIDAALKHNGMDPEAEAEETENFTGTGGNGSGSGSPSPSAASPSPS